jgi:hypothetical protein
MWEGPDTLGLISCIVGTVLLFIPVPPSLQLIVWVGGGAAVLAMGIVAVAKDSKIGIGGIILGALVVAIGLLMQFLIV